MKPENMTVLLTGACGGIGRAVARQLACEGANLYLTGRDQDKLDELENQLKPLMHSNKVIFTRKLDLSNDDQMDSYIAEIQNREHPVNVVINNAGISRFELIEKTSDHGMEQMIMLNTIAPMKLIRKLLPSLREQSQARIVNVGSTFGAIGFPGYSVYSASKYALRGFSEALDRELSDSQISVGCFMPRATQTAINTDKVIELNRRLKVTMDPPEKVASALMAFICSQRRITGIGWPEKFLMPFNSVFPSIVSNIINRKLPIIKSYAA